MKKSIHSIPPLKHCKITITYEIYDIITMANEMGGIIVLDQKLLTFLTICKIKNFTKAAEILNLTQPAVTKHIQALEEYYGASLLYRKGRTIDFTDEGKILFKYANDMNAQTALVERKIRNSVELNKCYTVGATLTIGEYVLPFILGKYKVIKPNIDIIMHVYNTEIITKKLLDGQIDLGLIEGPFDKHKFQHTVLKDDELVFTVSPRSKFSNKQEVRIDEIFESKLILREEGSGTRKVLEDKLVSLGFNLNHLKPYMEIGSLGAIKYLVQLDLGCTIISKAAIQKEIALGSLVAIPIKDVKITREFSFIFLKGSPRSFIDEFVEFSIKSLLEV